QSSARHRDEADIAPNLRLDDRPVEHAWIDGTELGNETDAEAACHKVENPVFALALVGHVERRATIPDEMAEIVTEFTVEPSQISLAIDIDDFDRGLAGEAMAGRKADEKAFFIKRLKIEALGKTL